MYDPANPVWHTISLGPLPVHVATLLEISLEPGGTVFSAKALKHAFEDQMHRRPICWPYLGLAVANPTHVGQQPKHVGKGFDLGYQIPGGQVVLVCVSLSRTRSGDYPITSSYPLDADSVERRVRLKTTLILK